MTGGTVVLDLVLANTGDAAVAMRGAWAFPTGVVLRLGLHRRPVGSLARDTFERFRFGVELPDGRKVLATAGTTRPLAPGSSSRAEAAAGWSGARTTGCGRCRRKGH